MEARDYCSELRIPANPECLWDAITQTDPATHRLFATEDGVDVHVGSRVMHRTGNGDERVWGQVVDVDRPRRLVMELEPWEHWEMFRVTLNIEPEGRGSRLAML